MLCILSIYANLFQHQKVVRFAGLYQRAIIPMARDSTMCHLRLDVRMSGCAKLSGTYCTLLCYATPLLYPCRRSLGVICFTSCSSNGGCWVVVVLILLSWKKTSIQGLHQEKKVYGGYTKKVLFCLLRFSIRWLQPKKKSRVAMFSIRGLQGGKKYTVVLFSHTQYQSIPVQGYLPHWQHWTCLRS